MNTKEKAIERIRKNGNKTMTGFEEVYLSKDDKGNYKYEFLTKDGRLLEEFVSP